MSYIFNSNSDPLYIKVYDYYMKMIAEGKLSAGSKLPSIRRCAEELQLSRTTIENAYMSLAADGYIISKSRSGFYVTDLAAKKKSITEEKKKQPERTKSNDLSSASADIDSFNFKLWRRYIKSALRQDERLLSYGEPQGESELRETLSEYISRKRNVVCTAENIVIGAGVQSLLHILCALMQDKNKIFFYENDFIQGKAIFRDHNWNIVSSYDDSDVIYTTPSHAGLSGNAMNSEERFRLINNTIENNKIIIEDDYDNEFSYLKKRAPSLQSLASGKNVIYISSFSKLLLPSIRISYMVLTDELTEKYHKICNEYNQTASKTEQIALCMFIRDGHMESQIRKICKIYNSKI